MIKEVDKTRKTFSKWVRELWIARKILSKEGRPLETGIFVPVLTWNKYCQDIGIYKTTANRWLNPKFIAHIAQSTGETEWDTPLEFIQSARQVMGSIDVDPASKNLKRSYQNHKRFI